MIKLKYSKPELLSFWGSLSKGACTGGASNITGDCEGQGSTAENVCAKGNTATAGLCAAGSGNTL